MPELVFTFQNTHGTIAGEQAMLAAGLPVQVANIPADISAGCGLCLALPPDRLQAGLRALVDAGIRAEGVYARRDGRYRPLAAGDC